MAGEIQLNGVTLATESSGVASIDSSVNIKGPLNASGSAPIYACRAWVNFNGTGTVAIRGSGNVSSVTDNGGNGNYTVNFTTAMPDTNFCAVLGIGRSSINYFDRQLTEFFNRSTSQINLYTGVGASTFEDQESVSVAIFR